MFMRSEGVKVEKIKFVHSATTFSTKHAKTGEGNVVNLNQNLTVCCELRRNLDLVYRRSIFCSANEAELEQLMFLLFFTMQV
jgi:hypothetical protein